MSDVDSQLLVCVVFREAVRLAAVAVDGPPETAPTTVKLYANRQTMTFDDVESTEPDAVLRLGAGDLGEPVKVRPPQRFSAVGSVFVFVERDDAAVVTLSALKFFGAVAAGGANVSNIKKIATEE